MQQAEPPERELPQVVPPEPPEQELPQVWELQQASLQAGRRVVPQGQAALRGREPPQVWELPQAELREQELPQAEQREREPPQEQVGPPELEPPQVALQVPQEQEREREPRVSAVRASERAAVAAAYRRRRSGSRCRR